MIAPSEPARVVTVDNVGPGLSVGGVVEGKITPDPGPGLYIDRNGRLRVHSACAVTWVQKVVFSLALVVCLAVGWFAGELADRWNWSETIAVAFSAVFLLALAVAVGWWSHQGNCCRHD